MDAKKLLNKQLVVGRAVLNENDNIGLLVYKHGRITRLSEEGFIIKQSSGEEYIPMLNGDVLVKAPRRKYIVSSTGETIDKPQLLLIQPGEAMKIRWREKGSPLAFPALCAHCGKGNEHEMLRPWSIKSNVYNMSTLSALTIFAGVIVKNRRTYTFFVPVCADCKAKLEMLIQIRNAVVILSMLLAVVGFVLWCLTAYQTINSINLNLGMWLTLIGILAFVLTLLLYRDVGRIFAAFDGAQFRAESR